MTRLRLIEPPPFLDPPLERGSGYATTRDYAVGDCWYATPTEDGGWTMYADGSAINRQRLTIAPEHAGVRPMIVVFIRDGEMTP